MSRQDLDCLRDQFEAVNSTIASPTVGSQSTRGGAGDQMGQSGFSPGPE